MKLPRTLLLTLLGTVLLAPLAQAQPISSKLFGSFRSSLDVYGPTGIKEATIPSRYVFKRAGKEGMAVSLQSRYGKGKLSFRDNGSYTAKYHGPFFLEGRGSVPATYHAAGGWSAKGATVQYTATYRVETAYGTYGGFTQNTLKRQGRNLVETYVAAGGYTGRIVYKK